MNRHKLLSVIAGFFLITVLGVMSWNSMHPPSTVRKDAPVVTGYYYVGPGITAAMVPNDSVPLIIKQGQKGDMTPVTFAQRQVSVLLHVDAIPPNPAPLIAQIEALRDAWDRQGTVIAGLIIDYRPEKPDFKSYAHFLQALKKATISDAFVVMSMADPSWMKNADIVQLQDDITALVFDITTPDVPVDLSRQLDTFDKGFMLKLPAGITQGVMFANPSYRGFILTLTPDMPVGKQQRKVGVFPKFLEEVLHGT